MINERYCSKLAVSLILTRTNQETGKKEILLQLRRNTGYMDHMYDFGCSGHVEKGESFLQALIRETKEELGIIVNEKDLIFKAVYHHCSADYVQLFFATERYEGIPSPTEADKCGGLLWTDINNLPEKTIPYVVNVIEDVKNGIIYDDGNSLKNTKNST